MSNGATTQDASQEQRRIETLPDPPTITGYQASGNDLSNPREIAVNVEFYTPGYVESHSAEVRFYIRDGVAELKSVSDRLKLPKSILAAEAASNKVAEHPAVESVDGVDALVQAQRTWISQCELYNGSGWNKTTEKVESNVGDFVEGYENEDGDRYTVWSIPEDSNVIDSETNMLVEYRSAGGNIDKTPVDGIRDARTYIAEVTGEESIVECGSEE